MPLSERINDRVFRRFVASAPFVSGAVWGGGGLLSNLRGVNRTILGPPWSHGSVDRVFKDQRGKRPNRSCQQFHRRQGFDTRVQFLIAVEEPARSFCSPAATVALHNYRSREKPHPSKRSQAGAPSSVIMKTAI